VKNKKAKLISKVTLKEPKESTLKALEKEGKLFETVMGAIGDLVSIQDLNMRIAYQNKTLKEVMGNHYGEYCYKIYERRDHICEGCPMQKSFKTGQIAKALRTGITKEGVARRYEVITAPLKDRQGKIVAGIEVVRDVHEREQALQEMDRIAKMLVGRDFELMRTKEKREAEFQELKKAEEQVRERTKDLQNKVEQLEKMNRLMVGRELKIIDFKKEIQTLKEKLEKHEPPFDS